MPIDPISALVGYRLAEGRRERATPEPPAPGGAASVAVRWRMGHYAAGMTAPTAVGAGTTVALRGSRSAKRRRTGRAMNGQWNEGGSWPGRGS